MKDSKRAKSLFIFSLLIAISTIWIMLDDGGLHSFKFKDQKNQQPPQRKSDPATLRVTESGPVIGFNGRSNTHVWLGIPYAQPPIGDLRWRAPQMPSSWTAPFEALQPGRPCTQLLSVWSAQDNPQTPIIGSEDCLYLNVWAPRSAAENAAQTAEQLPVMVWIHGGGHSAGSAHLYSGHQLAHHQQVVYVSIGYRLGYLGSFAHRALRNTASNPADKSGNYGVLDILATLQWVQKNIENFGGDSGNVTLFGASNGARNVMAMLASPLAEGLFHKAIVQSGSLRTESLESAENFIDDPNPGHITSSNELIIQLLMDLNIAADRDEAKRDVRSMSDASLSAFLRRQPATNIFLASRRNPNSQSPTYQIPQLIRDGAVLPDETLSKLFSFPANYNNVPMIIGSSRDEAKSEMAQQDCYITWPVKSHAIIRDRKKYHAMAALQSEQIHLLAVEEPARLLASSRLDVEAEPNVFTYRFDWDELASSWFTNLSEIFGATHSLETAFVFGDFESNAAFPMRFSEEDKSSRESLSAAMMDYWGAFVHTGSPRSGRTLNQPLWDPWVAKGPNTMIFDSVDSNGWRMEERHLSLAQLSNKVLTTTTVTSDMERCELFATMFSISDQSSDHWDPKIYKDFNSGACKNYKKQLFINNF